MDGVGFWTGVYAAIYTFHMPAFMFLSGIFAKADAQSTGKSFVKLTALFIVMTLLVAGSTYVAGGSFKFDLMTPVFSAWYLQALIIMRLLLPALSHVRYIVPILVTLSLITPYTNDFGGFLSLSRLVYFLPFFMLGYFMGLDGIKSLRNRMMGARKWLVLLAAIICISGFVYLVTSGALSWKFLWAKQPYSAFGIETLWVGAALRSGLIIAASLATIALISFLPAKRNAITYIGTNSLSVYILQACIVKLLPDTSAIDPMIMGCIAVIAAIAISAVCAAYPINKALGYPGDLAVNVLFKKDKE